MKKYLKQNKGLVLITTILGGLSGASTALIALLLQKIIDAATNGDFSTFENMMYLSIIFFLGMGLVKYLYSLCGKQLIKKIVYSMRSDVFLGVMRKNHQEFAEKNTASYLSIVTNDVKAIEENFLQPLLLCLQNAFVFVFALVILLTLSPIITLSLFGCLIIMSVVPALFGKPLQTKQEKTSVQASLFTEKSKDLFSGFEVIKDYEMESDSTNEFEKSNTSLVKTKFSFDKLLAVNEALSEVIAMGTIFLVIFIGSYQVLHQEMTLGSLVAIVQLTSIFISPVIMIMQNTTKMKSVGPLIAKVEELTVKKIEETVALPQPTFSDKIVCKNLSFSYKENQPVLSNINLIFEKGKKYAVVGPSGSGKSTMINLLTSTLTNYDGEILYDNQEIRKIDKKGIKNLCSIIHQNVYLFNTTIAHNICLSKTYTEKEQKLAMAASGVSQFIDIDETGLDIPVKENGSNFSGGQKQRIVMARALIRKSPLLVLDEGTSALDMQTAYQVEKDLLDIPEQTLITITHKLDQNLLSQYDSIIFMEDGKVVDAGSFNKIYQPTSRFYQFMNIENELKEV
ncbi:ABC transporter ATP-binding protein [Lysinibacillus sp. NPDC093692]|uniref:ABC transporter ATP-binding protein n=1 Tax=Lysinibacillus sp. NPDC093692 TaxID=3390578 RepID=UPI003D027E98